MEPFLFVIFGATGDLTNRKILPAIYTLKEKNLLPEGFALVGVARKEKSNEEFRREAELSVKKHIKKINKEVWEKLSSSFYYFRNDFDTEQSYDSMKSFYEEIDKKHNTESNRVFYLATMPRHFDSIINNLKGNNCINRNTNRHFRIIIEKPFGYDLESAKALNKKLKELFHEEEIFRIDHYLGKETVQNLSVLRFSNRLFEAVWNSENIEQIQITAAENLGVETRGNYYDSYGALKDMVQNHILQVLSLVAMEPPSSFDAVEIKKQKVKLFSQICFSEKDIKESTVFGQYLKGETGKDYREEEGIAPHSRTETYFAAKFTIDNARWKGMPFYIRTGKGLKRKASEIVIYFKEAEAGMFNTLSLKKNILVIRLQPDEGVYLRFNAKQPGNEFEIGEVSMDFCHECLFGFNTPEAYEKLLYDAFKGDPSLFTRWDEVESTWKIIDPIARYWKETKKEPSYYKIGEWGPKEAEVLLKRENHKWREPL
jgi:glucose-6-phosphate 1-dehydrogenase